MQDIEYYLGLAGIGPNVTVRDVVTSVVVAWSERRSLEDGAATSLAPRSTVSSPSHDQGKAALWRSRRTTPEADEQEPAEDASPNQQHLKKQQSD